MGNFRREKKRHPRHYCPIDWVECYDYNDRAQGVVEFKGKIINVHGLLKGEKARIHIFYETDLYGDAKVLEIEKKSKDRKLDFTDPKMFLGSYQLAHFTDAAQDEWKQNYINKIFRGFDVKKLIVGKREFYRNKVTLKNGGVHPPGRARKNIVVPAKGDFDLMDIDFEKFKDTKGDLIIRRLDTEISGAPRENKSTTHTMLGKKFHVALGSFFQVNNEMAEMVYKEIIKEVNEQDIVFDLFSGIATIGVLVSDKASQVYSVEMDKASHHDAVKNMDENNITNLKAINADVSKWTMKTDIKPDVIIIDPARAGLSQFSVVDINKMGARKIVYLSCNVKTQKRDIDGLSNYEIASIQPYDFFPQTYHIESLVFLNKK